MIKNRFVQIHGPILERVGLQDQLVNWLVWGTPCQRSALDMDNGSFSHKPREAFTIYEYEEGFADYGQQDGEPLEETRKRLFQNTILSHSTTKEGKYRIAVA